jgi:5'-3' exonuclease
MDAAEPVQHRSTANRAERHHCSIATRRRSMMKSFTKMIAVASVAITGIAATPAVAQDWRPGYDYNDRYDRGYEDRRVYDRRGDDRRGYDRRDYDRRGNYYDGRGYDARGYDDRRYDDGRRYQRSGYRGQRCSSGTTGGVLGAVVGGLLGREIGRGGYYNQPSTTGLLLGAGAGALAGRAIERQNCR